MFRSWCTLNWAHETGRVSVTQQLVWGTQTGESVNLNYSVHHNIQHLGTNGYKLQPFRKRVMVCGIRGVFCTHKYTCVCKCVYGSHYRCVHKHTSVSVESSRLLKLAVGRWFCSYSVNQAQHLELFQPEENTSVFTPHPVHPTHCGKITLAAYHFTPVL